MTDRTFRVRSFYKKYAKDLGIEWQDSWNKDQKIYWEKIPEGIVNLLKEYGNFLQENSKFIVFPKKHKYIYILGKNNFETKELKKEFLNKNKIYSYPKIRGNSTTSP